MADTKTGSRVVRHLSIAYFVPFTSPDGNKAALVRTARRGDVIDGDGMADGEVKRLEDLGALLPKGSKPEDAEIEREAILDLYRGQRGDTEAMARAVQRAGREQVTSSDVSGGIVDVSGGVGDVPEGGGKLADHITENKLTVDDTVALAGDDPAKAKRVLEAEHLASGGSPRQGVVDRLQKLIDG